MTVSINFILNHVRKKKSYISQPLSWALCSPRGTPSSIFHRFLPPIFLILFPALLSPSSASPDRRISLNHQTNKKPLPMTWTILRNSVNILISVILAGCCNAWWGPSGWSNAEEWAALEPRVRLVNSNTHSNPCSKTKKTLSLQYLHLEWCSYGKKKKKWKLSKNCQNLFYTNFTSVFCFQITCISPYFPDLERLKLILFLLCLPFLFITYHTYFFLYSPLQVFPRHMKNFHLLSEMEKADLWVQWKQIHDKSFSPGEEQGRYSAFLGKGARHINNGAQYMEFFNIFQTWLVFTAFS